jgi:hypothetical protein
LFRSLQYKDARLAYQGHVEPILVDLNTAECWRGKRDSIVSSVICFTINFTDLQEPKEKMKMEVVEGEEVVR